MKWRCKLCDSEDAEIVFRPPSKEKVEAKNINFVPTSANFGIFYRLARCKNCGILFSILEKKGINIRQSYSESKDNLYLSQRTERNITYQRILSHLKNFVSSNFRLLDIGCSYGLFLKIAQDNGMQVYGVDISKDACDYCKDILGLNVFCGDLTQANFPESYFDIVTAIEVIEHLEDPKDFLCQIHRILKPGGILYLVTPNIKSLSARLFRYRWWSFRRMHLYYFSKRTLYNFLPKNGFSVVCNSLYKKTFKIDYILHQLYRAGYNKIFYHFLSGLSSILGCKNLLVTASFGDIAVTAKRA